MTVFSIQGKTSIDYSILVNKYRESEREEVPVPSKALKRAVVEAGKLDFETCEDLAKVILRRNRLLDPTKSVSTTKSNTYVNHYDEVYRTLVARNNSILVEIDLNHCFPQILHHIGDGIDFAEYDFDLPNYDYIKNDLADFFSADIQSQAQLNKVMDYLLTLDKPLIALYLNKAIKLAERGSDITAVDAFGVEKFCKGLNPVEAMIMPITMSFNHLAHAIVETIEKKYTYYKKFFYIHKNKIYYFVRSSNASMFLDAEYYFNGKPLNIKVSVGR